MNEQESFLNKINLPETNGKHHRTHKELAKIISNLQERIAKLELFERMERLRYPDEHWELLERAIKKVDEQKERIRQEQKKLDKLKLNTYKVIYPYSPDKKLTDRDV